jgi:hypothetical protein
MQVYLVTSRDGYSFDLSWVYAHRPLELKGSSQQDWASGFVLPAAQIVGSGDQHRIYYEAVSMCSPCCPLPRTALSTNTHPRLQRRELWLTQR